MRIVDLVGERNAEAQRGAGVLNGVRHAGREVEAMRGPGRNPVVLQHTVHADADQRRADDRQDFSSAAMDVVPANMAGLGKDDMDVPLSGKLGRFERFEQTAPRVGGEPEDVDGEIHGVIPFKRQASGSLKLGHWLRKRIGFR